MTTDILDELRAVDADPVDERPFGELTQPALPPREPRSQRRISRRFLLVTAGVATATIAAVLAIGVPLNSQPGERNGIPAALWTASVASANAGSDGVRYSRMEIRSLMTTGAPGLVYSLRQPVVVDVWVRPDGSGRVRRTYLPAEWPGSRDKRRATRLGEKRSLAQAEGRRLPEDSDEALSDEELAEQVAFPGLPAADSLSSDPDELRQQLIDSDAFEPSLPANEALFRAAGGLVLSPVVEGDVRAAGYRVIGAIAGIQVDQAARDPRGRRATAVTLAEQRREGSASTLYFDPSTGQALAGVQRSKHRQEFLDSLLVGSVVLRRAKTVNQVPPVPAG